MPSNPLRILAAVPVYQPIYEKLLEIPGVELEVIDYLDSPRAVSAEVLRNKHALMTNLPPANFEEMRELRWVHVISAGYSELCSLDLASRGVRASNGLGTFDVPVAEWNIAMVNLARDVRGLIRNQNLAIWDRSDRFQREIRGSVVGFWGYGGIGRETARIAKAMGLKVHALVRSGVKVRDENVYCVPQTGDADGVLPDRVFFADELDSFLSGLDFLALTMPLTKQNEGIVGERELRMLSRHAFLLNPSRGPLVQEVALLRALKEGWIAGAAIDTHYQYPLPAEHPLWAMENVILTPHISGSSGSPRFLERAWDIFSQNVSRFHTGQPLLNELTASQLRGE
jgi:phosphoglycerate dehydrogenase-like enzyme